MDLPARAKFLQQKGRYAEALQVAEKVLRIQPKHADTLLCASICHDARGEQRAALAYADRAVEAAPNVPFAHTWNAFVHAKKGDRKRALSEARQAVVLAPQMGWVHRELGRVQVILSKPKEALRSLGESLRLDPEDVVALNLQALALTMTGRREEARQAAQTALHFDPESAVAHARMGWLDLSKGSGGSALSSFREALRINPMDKAARAGLLHSLRARNPVYRLAFRFLFLPTASAQTTRVLLSFLVLLDITAFTAGYPAVIPGLTLIGFLVIRRLPGLLRTSTDLMFRFDRDALRHMSRRHLLQADFLGLVLLELLLVLPPIPYGIGRYAGAAAAAAFPFLHALFWPKVPRRKWVRFWATALILFTGAACFALRGRPAIVAPVVSIAAALIFLLAAEGQAEADRI